MTRDDYKVADDNYIGYISGTDIAACSAFDAAILPKLAAGVAVGEEVYYRCGIYQTNFGTRVDYEHFDPWWDKFGGKMLTEAQLKEALSPIESVEG